jgi:hypothetical protein
MNQASFGAALTRLWPNGDQKVAGLRAGIIASAPEVFAKYGIDSLPLIAHVMAQTWRGIGCFKRVLRLARVRWAGLTELLRGRGSWRAGQRRQRGRRSPPARRRARRVLPRDVDHALGIDAVLHLHFRRRPDGDPRGNG